MSDVRELNQLDRCVLKTRPVRRSDDEGIWRSHIWFGQSLLDLTVQGPYILRPWEIMGRK
jgi:hypothetical protein